MITANQAVIAHDKEIFNKSDLIMTEFKLLVLLDRIKLPHPSLLEKHIDMLVTYLDFFTITGNQYLDSDVETTLSKLILNLNKLSQFVGNHFRNTSTGRIKQNSSWKLEPDLEFHVCTSKYNVEHNRYDGYCKTLESFARIIESDFQSYRKCIRKKLYV